jgi:FtsZ-binding cell division protein ZapB
MELDMGAAATASQLTLLLGTVDTLKRDKDALHSRLQAYEEQQLRLQTRLAQLTEEVHRDNARLVAALGQVLDRFDASASVSASASRVSTGAHTDSLQEKGRRELEGHDAPPPPPIAPPISLPETVHMTSKSTDR